MAKNASRKGAPGRERPSNDAAAEIAAHISAILNHPATPVCVYNALADAVCELDAPTSFWDSAEYITLALNNNVRKGGARVIDDR